MKSRVVSRFLALAASVMLLAGEAVPVFAEGDGIETVAEAGEEAVTEAEEEETEYGEEPEDGTEPEADASAETDEVPAADGEKPAGEAVASAELGVDVTGTIYNEDGKVILYVDGTGTTVSTRFSETALKDYAVTDIRFGGKVAVVERVFDEMSSLKYVEVSEGITSLDKSFWGCGNLETVYFAPRTKSIKLCWAFTYCRKLNTVNIPKTLIVDGTESPFNEAQLGNVTLEDGMNSIQPYLFKNTGLSSINIPSTVTDIGEYAFSGCGNLSEITIPENVKTIGDRAFYECKGLQEVVIPASVVAIDKSFWGCTNLEKLYFAPRTKTIKLTWAFAYCRKLNTVNIPKTLVVDGTESPFNEAQLGNVSFEEGVTTIQPYLFMHTGLTEITLPSALTKVEKYAFYDCKNLVTVTYPGKKSKQTIKKASGEKNEALFDLEWIMTGGSDVVPTGEIRMDGEKVTSLKAAFKNMKENKDYTIELESDVKGEVNLTIPKSAKSVTINGNGYCIDITGSKLTANCPLILIDVDIAARKKADGDYTKFTLYAKKGLALFGEVHFRTLNTLVKSNADVELFTSLYADGLTCKNLVLNEGGILEIYRDYKCNIKGDLVGKGGKINFAGVVTKPVSIGGRLDGTEIGLSGDYQQEGTQIFKCSAKKIDEEALNHFFDADGISYHNTAEAVFVYTGAGRVCVFGKSIEYNGKSYALWKDVIADVNADVKNGEKAPVIGIIENVDLNGKFLLPKKGYEKLTIDLGGYSITTTGDLKLTGDLDILDGALYKLDKKGNRVKGKITKGKYDYNGPEFSVFDI